MKVREIKSVNDNEYLSTEEAAQELGIKETAVRNYLSSEKFTTYKFKNFTLLKADEVENWKIRQRKK